MSNGESRAIIDGGVKQHVDESQKPRKKKQRKRYRSRSARLTIGVIRLVVLGYITILGTLIFMETRLVYPGAYFKDRPTGTTPQGIETVEYTTSDGMTIRSRFMQRPQSEEVVLFFHGNGVKAKWLDDWIVLLADEFDASVMAAEYRGYDDDATPNERGVLADCFAARDYVCTRMDKTPTDIILYGQSLGGGCAVAIASQGGAKAVVLERTFDRLVNVAGDKYPFIPVRYLMRNRYDSVAKVTVYKSPLVMLHGTADRLIPMQHGRRLFEAAPSQQKHWIAVDGLGHNDPLPLERLREIVSKVREFTATP